MSKVYALVREIGSAPKPLLAAAIALVIARGALPVGLAVSLIRVIDAVSGLDPRRAGDARGDVVLFAVLFLLTRLVDPLCKATVADLGARVESALRVRVMDATLAEPGVGHLDDPRYLDRSSVALGINTGRYAPAAATEALLDSTSRLVTAAGGIVLVSAVHLVAGVLLGAVYLATAFRLRRAAFEVTDAETHREWRRALYLRDLALDPKASKEATLLGLGPWLRDAFIAQWRAGLARRWGRISERRDLVAVLALQLAAACAAFVFVTRAAVNGRVTLAEALLALLGVRMITEIAQMTDADRQLAEGMECVPAIRELETRGRAARTAGTVVVPSGPIRFENVSFRYPTATAPTLCDISFTLEPGSMNALVGLNGAGKSTIVSLLCALYQPSAGAVTIDGVPIDALDVDAWRASIAVVFQDFLRYQVSLEDNIRYGSIRRAVSQAELDAVAEQVGLARVLQGLPNGWETVLSRQFADGRELSGGQWQRVALARALVGRASVPRLLILDEPTSNVDPRFEAAFFERCLRANAAEPVTTLLVSHRFSNVRKADHIIVVDGGRVVEQGGHESLMEHDGLYRDMFETQAASFR